ncbi:type IV pili methyl-accepting chemotaxis transducer N-terminal domain-containing protein [Belliella sp. DSM 111904]|uniref:histidine kinase n=1 Tax=Belliella filtrata TaxID=2923435 RepID=A0ABS9UZW2_9BACT|nr:ATP-binding protein [Belliella filtrata]MCH7409509.1 type IV pili methyl-accepting chemotaxis transducer N-terminal domain-containing protein [Belliella filtrata]
MKKVVSGRLTFENLRWRYLIALSAIALTIVVSQALLQHHISMQTSDSVEINLSGRQRMLSQRISKAALILTTVDDNVLVNEYKTEIESSLLDWQKTHQALQFGETNLGLKGISDAKIKTYFEQIQENFDAIVDNVSNILIWVEQGRVPNAYDDLWINQILANERVFLTGMDQIVYTFDRNAHQKVLSLRKVEFWLFGITFLLILIEVRFIFWPSAVLIRDNFIKLSEGEAKAKSMALELSSLYETLVNSYLEIVDTEPLLNELQVFGKFEIQGEFKLISAHFKDVMQFSNPPQNFFDWLVQQGVEEIYVSKIQEILSKGLSWEGELRLFNQEGDFIWLDMNLTPLLEKSGEVSEILFTATDMTTVKEARARSQEIHRENLEKKLKEQQYRSSLILEGQEEERRRISRDLHDGIGQYLTALKYSLDGINDVKTQQEVIRLDVSKELIGKVIKEVRRVSFHLTPVILSDHGIASVLNKFSQEMSKISRIPVIFENLSGFISRLDSKIENNLYRIVQEAVNNAIKYADASQITIKLSHNAKFLHIEVADDGIGFDYEKLKQDGHFTASGHGIFNIKERVSLINGNFELITSLGNGTSIRVEVELEN